MPRKPPPPGLITAGDAAKKLGVSTGMLSIYVKQGKLHREGPASRTYKFYIEAEVLALAATERAFFEAEKEDIDEKDAVFAQATADDIPGIYDLAERIFHRTTSMERRMEWLQREPRGHYVVRRKHDNKIVAYLTLLPIKPELLIPYMHNALNRELAGDDIHPFRVGTPATCIIKGIASDPDTDEVLRSHYVAVLLRGIRADLERLGHEGVTIPALYAFSNTDSGIAMCIRLGMKEWEPSQDGKRFTFQINVTSSDAFVLQLYKRGIAEWRRQHPERLTFTRATPDDMEGVYQVASSLFDKTTSAADRMPLVARCSDGNYVLKNADTGVTLAYVHLQPLKSDRLQAFLKGEIRGWQLTAEDLDLFEPGKEVDVLVKSMGATRAFGEVQSTRYMQRLLFGTARAMAELGKKGVIVHKVYATSETSTGINLAMHAHMQQIGRISPDRYAFELDVATSNLPLLRSYKKALAEWRQQFPKQLVKAVTSAEPGHPLEKLAFRRAEMVDMDQEGYLAYLCFGPRARDTMPMRQAFLAHNPDMFYHLYDQGNLAAAINIVPLKESAIEEFKQGKRGWLFKLDEIEQYTPGPHHLIIIDFMTAPVESDERRTLYATQLLMHLAQQFAHWGEKGVEILSVHASGGTDLGRRILRSAGFHEIGEPVPGRVIFELNVSSSSLKLLRPYKAALAAWQQANAQKNEGS